MTSLWRHTYVIFLILGGNIENLISREQCSLNICLHIFGKHLPSCKIWFIFRLNISVPDWKISVLKSTKISENQKNWKSSWRFKNLNFVKMTDFIDPDHQNEQFVSSIYTYSWGFYRLLIFCFLLGFDLKLEIFFSDQVIEKIQKTNSRH